MARYGLFVGIDNYEDRDDIQPLRYAVPDAIRMHTFFVRCGFHSDLLTDSRATSRGIMAKLKQTASRLVEGDVFVFYFSGHGYQWGATGQERQYLLPRDADIWALRRGGAGAIPMRFIQGVREFPALVVRSFLTPVADRSVRTRAWIRKFLTTAAGTSWPSVMIRRWSRR